MSTVPADQADLASRPKPMSARPKPMSVGPDGEFDHVAVMRSLEAIAAVAGLDEDPYSALNDLVRVITEVTPWGICWAAVLDPQSERVVLQQGSGFGTSFSQDAYEGWEVRDSLSARAIETGLPIAIADVESAEAHPLVQTDAVVRGFRSMLVLPVTIGELSGALWLCRPEPHAFTDAESVFAYAIASHVAVALRNAYDAKSQRALQESQLDDLDGLARLHETTIRQKERLERISAIHERLIQLVLNHHGLLQLAETAARLLEKPVLLFDRFDHVLCSVGLNDAATAAVEAELGPRLRTDFTNRPARASFVALQDERYLVVPIASDSRSLGNLCVPYAGSPARDLDIQLAEQVGLFFALELLKERIRLDVALRLDSDLFSTMISSSTKLTQPQLEQAALRGLDLVRPSVVIRVRVTPPPDTDWFDVAASMAWLLRSKIAQFGPNASASLFPAQNAEMVVIVNGDPLPSLHEQVLPTIRSALTETLMQAGCRGMTISSGIGTVGSGIEGLRTSHDAAVKALSVIDMLGMDGSDVDMSDFATYGLLLSIAPDQQATYVGTVLGTIFDYDRSHSAEFIKTLDCYLETLGSVQRTAEALFLHPTTVRYRLGRIEDLSGFKLDNVEHRLTLSLALRLHRLAKHHTSD